ncbi:MAG: hypothetical protein P8O70_09700 [SAR324 cluster bacterium]|nr:hypothetical protein [SAR324 cluster bacterium]
MSTPDTSIYIVGTNRTWQIRAKTLKLILTSTVLLLIGLAAALLYQSIWHLQVVGGWEERYATENERNEKMRSVIEDLRERVVDRGTLEMRQAIYSNGPDPEELLQKNQRQQETIEAQQLRIEQLQSETNDQQVQLIELDVQLTDEIARYASLQESHQQLEIQRTILQDNLTSLNEELVQQQTQGAVLQKQILSLQKQLAAIPKIVEKPTQTLVSTPTTRSPALAGPSPIAIEKIQLNNRNGQLNIRFQLSNRDRKRQTGFLQTFLVSADDAVTPVKITDHFADPFAIRNFKNVRAEFKNWDKSSLLRVVAWNAKKQRVYDKTFPLNKVN